MPPGTRHEFIGTIEQDASGLILRLHDGHRWRLNALDELKPYVGQEVKMWGTNSGSGLLHMDRVERLGPPPPPQQPRARPSRPPA